MLQTHDLRAFSEGESVVDYRRAFVAIRKDPKWMRKIALGALIAFIPYVGMAWVYGWEMEYQRSVAWGDDERLPGWSNFSGQAMQGLRAYVAVLPYSFVLAIVMVPLVFVVLALAGLSAYSDASSEGLFTILGMAAAVVVTLGITVLILPLSSSVMLRVSLYQTIGSGFELKEIWRLMRAGKHELLRAWGFSAINVAISVAVMISYFGLVFLVITRIPGFLGQNIGIALAVAAASYFGYAFIGMAVGLFLGLANMHYFGSYGRSVYGLADRGVPYSGAAPSDAETQIASELPAS
jgi:hypothetical protein